MLKKELIDEVADRAKVTNDVARRVIDSVCDVSIDAVRKGGDVYLLGLGKIVINERGAKKARNIRTGESVIVPPRKVPVFRPSVAIAKAANGE